MVLEWNWVENSIIKELKAEYNLIMISKYKLECLLL